MAELGALQPPQLLLLWWFCCYLLLLFSKIVIIAQVLESEKVGLLFHFHHYNPGVSHLTSLGLNFSSVKWSLYHRIIRKIKIK